MGCVCRRNGAFLETIATDNTRSIVVVAQQIDDGRWVTFSSSFTARGNTEEEILLLFFCYLLVFVLCNLKWHNSSQLNPLQMPPRQLLSKCPSIKVIAPLHLSLTRLLEYMSRCSGSAGDKKGQVYNKFDDGWLCKDDSAVSIGDCTWKERTRYCCCCSWCCCCLLYMSLRCKCRCCSPK